MDEIRNLLSISLIIGSKDQLVALEAKAAYACAEYRKAEEELSRLRAQMYDPSGKTELERKIALESVCRVQQREVSDWKDLVALIAQRIQLGMELLR